MTSFPRWPMFTWRTLVTSIVLRSATRCHAASLHVTLVRHGQTEWNAAGRLQGSSDSALTARGIHGAEACGQRLRERTYDAAYCSPLPRARHTAEVILGELAEPPMLRDEPRLRERHFGRWEGLEWGTIQSEYGEELALSRQDAAYRIAGGGESRLDTLERALEFLDELPQEHSGTSASILCVTHSATAASLIKEVLGLAQEARRSFEVMNCAITTIEYDPDTKAWMLLTLNDCAHLSE